MMIHGYQYNVENGAVYGKNGKEIKGVLEFTTPNILPRAGRDTPVFPRAIRYKYKAGGVGQKEAIVMKDAVLKAGMRKQTDNLKELFKLIEKRPDLPVVAMVDCEVVGDDSYGYWMGEWGKCEIDKYIVHENYGVIFYEQGRPDTVDIFEKYFDYEKCGIDEEMPDEQALPLMKEKIDTLDWTEAIIVYIDLPETILREV